MTDLSQLKLACLMHLSESAMEHPIGHQGKLAARFVIKCANGDVAELMFEKGPKTRANLWVLHSRVSSLIAEPGLEFQSAPSAGLFATKGEDRKAKYGRHSALKTMRELGHGDLICFRLRSVMDLEQILAFITKTEL